MDEKEFEQRASEALKRIERALQDEDLDADLAGDVLKVDFEDGSTFVINSHAAARQIWMSANMRAWHFSWDGKSWRESKGGTELFSEVGRLVSEKLARAVNLRS